jgi:hypothetical protein
VLCARAGPTASPHTHCTPALATPPRSYFILNIDGMYIGDRTSDLGPVFLPDANNTVWLPVPSEMTPQQRERFEWALYPGSMGGDYMGANTQSITWCVGAASSPCLAAELSCRLLTAPRQASCAVCACVRHQSRDTCHPLADACHAPHPTPACSLFNNLTAEGTCNATNPANWYLQFFLEKLPRGVTTNVSELVWK